MKPRNIQQEISKEKVRKACLSTTHTKPRWIENRDGPARHRICTANKPGNLNSSLASWKASRRGRNRMFFGVFVPPLPSETHRAPMNCLSQKRHLVVLLTTFVFFLTASQNGSGQEEPAPATPPKSPAPVTPADPVPIPGDASEGTDDYEVLMQGPVHEAFATPLDVDPSDGVRVYPKAPPEPVDEQPPEIPEGEEELTWIPGYWAWDDNVDDYVWVSGLYRKVPPGRTWTPGYWSKTASGYRWTRGFWAGDLVSSESVDYLPPPPESIDNGPSVPPPGEDYFWVPGHWEYAGNRYSWQSGFWGSIQDNWVWQPSCYVYTPQGYRMIDGYWDYLPTSRGYLYSPVRFYNPVYLRPSYIYRPRYPLASTASLLVSLFVRRGYPNYFYGDFFGPSYRSLGYLPWYDIGYGNRFGWGYRSPWVDYYDWKYRKSGINFVGSMQRYEQHLRSMPRQSSSFKAGGNNKDLLSAGPRSDFVAGTKQGKFQRSLDDVVRSDVGRVAIDRDRMRGNLYSTNPGQAKKLSSAGLSSSGQFPTPSAKLRGPQSFGSKAGALPGSSPSFQRGNTAFQRSSLPSLDRGKGLATPGGTSPSFNRGKTIQLQRSGSPSFDRGKVMTPSVNRGNVTPSFNRGNVTPLQRGPSPSFNRGPSPTFNRGPSPSFNRGPSPSLNRGPSKSISNRGASGFSAKGSSGFGGNRGSGKAKGGKGKK